MFTSSVKNSLERYCNNWIQAQTRSLLPYVLSLTGVSIGQPSLPSWNAKVTTAIEIKRTIALKEYICWMLLCFWTWGNLLACGKSDPDVSKTNHRVSSNSGKCRKELCLNSRSTASGGFFHLLDWELTKDYRRVTSNICFCLTVFGQDGRWPLASSCKTGSRNRGFWNPLLL